MDKNIVFKVENLYKRYSHDDDDVLKGVNLKIKGGMIFGFLGHNGVGKSTFIKSAIGLISFNQGNCSLCGVNLRKNPGAYKRLLGFVPDEYVLYEKLTPRELFKRIGKLYGLPTPVIQERASYYVHKLNLEFALDREIGTFSHGMKQKVAIIISLLHEPKLWILDEPLTGLDPISVMQVKEIMKEYAQKGNIVFFSSHIINIVQNLCTDIGILSDGVIASVANLDKLKAKKVDLEKYYLDITHRKK